MYLCMFKKSNRKAMNRNWSNPYENIQQYFSNRVAEMETRFLAGFLLLFSYNNSNTSAIISGKIFKLGRILLKILFKL